VIHILGWQPANLGVSALDRDLQHVLFLAFSENKMDKLQALPGVLGKRLQLLTQV